MIDLHQEDEKLFALVGACQRDVLLRSSQKQNRNKSLYPVSSVPDFAKKTSAYLKVTWFPKDTNGLRN